MNPIEYYTYMYPQLTLEVKEGMSKSEEYRNIVLRGIFPDSLVFPMQSDDEEELIKVETPIGEIEAIYLPIREVFERFVICLSNKCEPIDIPKTTGAMYISGLNCWRKIYNHKEEYLLTHDDWDDEFDRFIANKENYKGTVLLISKGFYSACSPEFVGIDEKQFLNISKDIRIYHEISHAITRKLYNNHQDPIRDEVIADSIGVLYALNRFDKELIKKFLGCEGSCYRKGGRLENYIDSDKLEQGFEYVCELLDKLETYVLKNPNKKPFEYLIDFEEYYIK